MIPFGTHIAAALVTGVLAFGAAWQAQGMRYGLQIEQLKHQATQSELQQAMRERAEQDAAPRNDPPLLPRID